MIARSRSAIERIPVTRPQSSVTVTSTDRWPVSIKLPPAPWLVNDSRSRRIASPTVSDSATVV